MYSDEKKGIKIEAMMVRSSVYLKASRIKGNKLITKIPVRNLASLPADFVKIREIAEKAVADKGYQPPRRLATFGEVKAYLASQVPFSEDA